MFAAVFFTSATSLSCNTADTAIWDKTGKANFASDEKTCALRCGGQNPCTGDCMSSKYGYSHDCGQCFGALSSCVVAHCLGSGNCAIAPNGEACKSCTEQHCTPAFESCTGFKPSATKSLSQYFPGGYESANHPWFPSTPSPRHNADFLAAVFAIPDGAVLCAGQPKENYCDCQANGDCQHGNGFKEFCFCDEAKKCCADPIPDSSSDSSDTSDSSDSPDSVSSANALRHPRHNADFLAAVLAIPDGAVLCAGQPKENYCDCQANGDCQHGNGFKEFCFCDEAKKCCADPIPDSSSDSSDSSDSVSSAKALRHPRHNADFLAAVLAIPDGTVLCAGQPKENYCDCQGDCTGLPKFCSCDEAKKCCTGATATVTCPGQTSDNYCDCQGDCTYNPEFCGCDAAKKCCTGKDLGAPLVVCNAADTKIWDSTGKAHFGSDEKTCAMRCGGQNPCTGDCMSSKYGYSHACGQCFGSLSSCVVAHCLGSGNCAIDPSGEACKSCTNQHCTPALESCTGWTSQRSVENYAWLKSVNVNEE